MMGFDTSMVIGLMPWLVVLLSAAVICRFLLHMNIWDDGIPWQIRAYGRFLMLLLFVYLLQLLILVYVPEARTKVFLDGTTVSLDLIKMIVGAIIGSIVPIIKNKNSESSSDEETKV